MKGLLKALLVAAVFCGAATVSTGPLQAMDNGQGSISGVVRLAEITGYDGGRITHRSEPCFGCMVIAGRFITITGPEGQFRLAGIPEGTYSIQIDYEACSTGKHEPYSSPSLTLSQASPTYSFDAPIDLYESTATLAGVAQLAGRSVHSGIAVTVAGIPGYSTTTDAQGTYTIHSIPVRIRSYQVVFAKPGFAEAALQGIVVAEQNSVLTLAGVNLAPAQAASLAARIGQ